MLTSEQIKKIKAEVAPFIRRQMEDAAVIASFRDVVATAGGDWAALKAVIKAEIQDEDAGDGKKIGKVAEKAEWTRIYLDLLGIAPNMNEENFVEDHDPETGEILDTSSTAARKDVQSVETEHPGEASRDDTRRLGTAEADGAQLRLGAGTQAPSVDTIQEPPALVPADPQWSETASWEDAAIAAPEPSTDFVVFFDGDADARCLNPELCGSNSRLGVCEACQAAWDHGDTA